MNQSLLNLLLKIILRAIDHSKRNKQDGGKPHESAEKPEIFSTLDFGLSAAEDGFGVKFFGGFRVSGGFDAERFLTL